MYESAKDFMQDYKKVFGVFEYKVKYQNDKGMVELKSQRWRDDPPNLKAYKAIDCILPVYLRYTKPQAKSKDKKNIIKEATKYKEIT